MLRCVVFIILAALSPLVVTTSVLSQEVPVQGERAPFSAPFHSIKGAQVPYPVRAEVLFDLLARRAAEDVETGTEGAALSFRSLGFTPDSAAVRELIDLAVALEREHPRISREIKEQAKMGNGLDLDQPGGWMDQRYAKVGRALGSWLLNRQAEGWAIEPLLDRLFNNGQTGIAIFSDDSEALLLKKVERQCALMNEALANELGYVPQRFVQQQEGDQR